MLRDIVFLIFQAREIVLNHVFDSKIWIGYSNSAIGLPSVSTKITDITV